MVTCHWQ